MQFTLNMLLETLADDKQAEILRVIFLSHEDAKVITINISARNVLPVIWERADLENMVLHGELRQLELDPYALLACSEDQIPKKHKQSRDRAFAVIKPLLESGAGKDIFIPRKRGKLIQESSSRTGISKPDIYRYLRLWWQKGQTKNALLPDWSKCGAKGKTRDVGERKRGRPNAYTQTTNYEVGINITPEIKALFIRGIKKFVYKDGKSIAEAYRLTMCEYFNKGYEERDGIRVPVMPPPEQLPTYGQFYYWYQKEYKPEEDIIGREGRRRFNLRYRPLLSDSISMVSGPGECFEIDATPANVHLRSYLTGKPIGRATVYFCTDVFSKMITGYVANIENASWLNMMLALENVATDKVEYCRRYEINITEAQWPSKYLPQKLIADRGEGESYNADNLAASLNVEVINPPPYRADLKGDVESDFWQAFVDFFSELPGFVTKRERGDKSNPVADAVLTIYQFNQALIRYILYHNNGKRMENYPLSKEMIRDKVEPYPVKIWQWGIENRPSYFRVNDIRMVRANLLPEGEASVTREGILFRGLFYNCELAEKEGWYVEAATRGGWKIVIAYDPRAVDNIYIRLNQGRHIEPCYLLDKTAMKPFQGLSWDEVTEYKRYRNEARYLANPHDLTERADYKGNLHAIITNARNQNIDPPKDKKESKNIRENRKEERSHHRSETAWDLSNNNSTQSKAGTDKNSDGSWYVPPAQDIDLIRKLLDQSIENDKEQGANNE